MKKFSIILLTLVIAYAMLIPTFSVSFNQNDNCDIELTVKKADPSKVVKDGIISEGEYEKMNVDTNPLTSSLNLTYGSTLYYDKAEAMMKTIEYYFSWDETHGLNLAVKVKPETIFQELDIDEGEMPHDNFLCNCGLHLTVDANLHNDDLCYETGMLYRFAIAKRTNDNRYLVGWYEALGTSGNYIPTPEQDFIINYPGDGYVIYEWSVPFSEINASGAGDELYISLSATAGDSAEGEFAEYFEHGYGVGLGDYGYMIKRNIDSQHCTLFLVADEIVSNSENTDADETINNGGGEVTAAPGESAVVTEIETDENGETHIVTKVVAPENNNNNSNNTNGGKQTGDSMIIIAAVAAVSAVGVVIFKKKH